MTRANRLRLAVLTLLAVTHLWLAPFTFANPPEPPWLCGVFAETDDDDVVLAEMAMTAVVETRPVPEETVQPSLPLDVSVDPVPRPTTPPRAVCIRAPPTA